MRQALTPTLEQRYCPALVDFDDFIRSIQYFDFICCDIEKVNSENLVNILLRLSGLGLGCLRVKGDQTPYRNGNNATSRLIKAELGVGS